MVETASQMLPTGTRAPSFSLTDSVSGRTVSLDDFEDDRVLVVMFICNHCPYVKHVRDEIGRFARDYRDKSVGIVAVNANSIETHPQDGPENMKALAEEKDWDFPYLFDETQEVAKSFRAACTPDFFVFDADRRLVYRGQFDDSRPGNDIPVDGRDLRTAVDAALEGKPVPPEQKPSIGCNIKWKPGNEPDYFGA